MGDVDLPDTRVVVTANTERQLAPRPGPSSPSGMRLCRQPRLVHLHRHRLHSASSPGTRRTWRVDAITWSENNTEAFAGLHNKGRRAFVLFDEASAIADQVWEVTEGALTDDGTEMSGASSATRRATPAASANASPAAASPIAGSRAADRQPHGRA